jgi:uncharacterized protein (TIGR02265 family)
MRGTSVDLEQVRAALGVARRIADTPPSASTRGVWFMTTARHMTRLGPAEVLAWREATGGRSRVPFRMYPVREYIDELAVAAALSDPDDPVRAIRSIWKDAVPTYVNSAFGRSLIRLIRPNPLRFVRWLADHRDHFCDYGKWHLVERGTGYVTMEIEDEWVWIESAHRGGAEGMLAACGVEGSVEPELETPYSGRLHIRWTPHA